jgi:type II secretory pathway pseudopilin PulG
MKNILFKGRRIRRDGQRGDTIVEVIIAVAIVSAILAGAFVVTNQSARAVRDSEEHAQALQLLQGQVELLRSAAARPGTLPASLSTPFCLANGRAYQPAASDTHCTLNSLYQVSISSPVSAPTAGTTTTFNLVAAWPALGGGTDDVYLSYKVEVAL